MEGVGGRGGGLGAVIAGVQLHHGEIADTTSWIAWRGR